MKISMSLEMMKHQILVWLGVEEKLRQAFHEGFSMAHDTDPRLCASNAIHPDQVREIVRKTRTWRSAEEAWQNSDAQEPFERVRK